MSSPSAALQQRAFQRFRKSALSSFEAISMLDANFQQRAKQQIADTKDALTQANIYMPLVHGMHEYTYLDSNCHSALMEKLAKGTSLTAEETSKADKIIDALVENLEKLEKKVVHAYLAHVYEGVEELHDLQTKIEEVHRYLQEKGTRGTPWENTKDNLKKVNSHWGTVAQAWDTISHRKWLVNEQLVLTGEKIRAACTKAVADLDATINNRYDKMVSELTASSAAAPAAAPVDQVAEYKKNMSPIRLTMLLRNAQVTITYLTWYETSYDDISRGEYSCEYAIAGTSWLIHTHNKADGKIKVANLKHEDHRYEIGHSHRIEGYSLNEIRPSLA